jgi:hypothetical protein
MKHLGMIEPSAPAGNFTSFHPMPQLKLKRLTDTKLRGARSKKVILSRRKAWKIEADRREGAAERIRRKRRG